MARFFRVLTCLPIVPAAMTVLAVGSWTAAAEAPGFDVSITGLVTVDTVTPADSIGPGFKPHLNFPYMSQRHDGTILIIYTVGQTQSGLQYAKQAISADGGPSWTDSTSIIDGGNIQMVRPPGTYSRGFSVGFSTGAPGGGSSWLNSSFTSTDGGTSWLEGASAYDTSPISYTSVAGAFGRVRETGSTWYLPGFAQRPGLATFESILLVSSDLGVHWNRRSTLSTYVSGLNLNMGSEGPSETSMVPLDNGDLLAVFRTGQPFPNGDIEAAYPSLFWTVSSDQGFTWSTPKMLGVAGVSPLLHKLPDGAVALTFGRYGAKVMFADRTGRRWTEPFVVYAGPGSGHTDMRRVSSGLYVFTYDQSSFYPPGWNGSPPSAYVYDNDQSANLMVALLDIEPLGVVDDFPWALEFHGDQVPDALPEPWWRVLSGPGPISARLWADLGQDYLRLETGPNGPNNLFHYGLSGGGSGSSWDAMDFSHGVVIEMRARVTRSDTADGAASLRVDDGANGAVELAITGTDVRLKGTGQVAYSPPGYAPLEWHAYRLVIEPDGSAGGSILASLYVDGDLAQPVLTRLPAASAADGIVVGDVVGAANGYFEVDYVRFALIPPCPSGDFNCDGAVDTDDLGPFADCLNGPDRQPEPTPPTTTPGCLKAFDADADADVDLADFAFLQGEFAGP